MLAGSQGRAGAVISWLSEAGDVSITWSHGESWLLVWLVEGTGLDFPIPTQQ